MEAPVGINLVQDKKQVLAEVNRVREHCPKSEVRSESFKPNMGKEFADLHVGFPISDNQRAPSACCPFGWTRFFWFDCAVQFHNHR